MNLNRECEPGSEPAEPTARLVTRSELARIAGVSPAAITKACKAGLASARVGALIDLDADAAQTYLANRGVSPTTVRPSDADLEALRAAHGEVFRVSLSELEHELVIRTPTRDEIAAFRGGDADERAARFWACLVWPVGEPLERLRARYPGEAGSALIGRAVDAIGRTPRGARARATRRKKKRRK